MRITNNTIVWVLLLGIVHVSVGAEIPLSAPLTIETQITRLKLHNASFDQTYAKLLQRFDPVDYEDPVRWSRIIVAFSETYIQARSDYYQQSMYPWDPWYSYFDHPHDATPAEQTLPAAIHILHDLPRVLKNYEDSEGLRLDFQKFNDDLMQTLISRVSLDSQSVSFAGRELLRRARMFSYQTAQLVRDGRHRLAQIRIRSAISLTRLGLGFATEIIPLTESQP